jgi:hypothetical protein
MSSALVHQPDCCSNCRTRLEVTRVKFRLAGAVVVSGCPKCVIASADAPTNPQPSRPENVSLASLSRSFLSRGTWNSFNVWS